MFKKENWSILTGKPLPDSWASLSCLNLNMTKEAELFLKRSVASAATSDEIKKWADGLASDRMDIFAGLDQCIAFTAASTKGICRQARRTERADNRGCHIK